MTTLYPIECASCGRHKPRAFKFCSECSGIVETEGLKPNTCYEQDCNEVIADGHNLCRFHRQQFQKDKISPCQECGEYKPANYALCRQCNAQSDRQPSSRNHRPGGNSPGQQVSDTRRPNEHHDAKAENKRYWFDMQDNGICNYCGNRYPYDQLEMEHMVPKELRGPDSWRNMQLTCAICNKKKGTSTDREFRRLNSHLIPTEERTPPPNWIDPNELKPGTQGPRYRGSPSESERRTARRTFVDVDIVAVRSWLVISAVLGVIIGVTVGYVVELRASRSVLEYLFGAVGLMTFGIVALALMWLALRRWWWRPRLTVLLRSLWWSLLPVAGKLWITLIWAFWATFAGGLLGGVSGYVIGVQTAQSVFDLAEIWGMAVFVIIEVTVVILIIFAWLRIATSSGQASSLR